MQQLNNMASLRRDMMVGAILPGIITSILIALIVYVVSSLGLMKMYEKAGEKNGKAWIPVYNTYVLVDLCWNKKWFWPALGGYVFIIIFGNLKVGSSLATVFAVLIVLVFIGLFVWKCFCSYFVAKKFGKSVPGVIGIIFLDWLFYLFLGFGESEFDGGVREELPKKEAKSPEKKPVAKPAAKKATAKKAAEKPAPKPAQKPASRPAAKTASAPKTEAPKKKTDYIDPKPKINF